MQVRAAFISSGILAAILVATASSSLAQPQQFPDQPAYQPADQAVDPPGRVARISVLRGDVSLQAAGIEQFSQAETNYPLTNGDRVYTDLGSLAELQTAGLSVRLGNAADLTISALTDQIAQFGLAQGSIRVRTRDLNAPDGTQGSVEIDTPNGTVYVVSPGDIRVDFYPQNDTTVVTVNSGQARVQGQNLDQTLSPNESIRMVGNPPSAQYLRLLPPDPLDQFDQERDQQFQRNYASQEEYVGPEMIGAEELAQYGDWSANPDYGNVWFPRGVDIAWTPYHNGHWAYIQPWGWTWVEAEPWGFAPFHYGRWANFGGRWGWVPGPPTRVFGRPVRPVYSPALVAFVGGPGFSLSIGGGGLGVTAWFPLGPREPYRPWYRASPTYVNRVNVTNIYNRNVTEVRNNYNNRTVNVYERNDRDQNFQNRSVGTTAVSQRDFAAGRKVDEGQRLRMDDRMRQQVNQAPVAVRPVEAPSPGIRAPQAPARALPPNTARPQWDARGGDGRNQQRPQGNQGGYNQPGNTQPANGQGSFDRGRQGQPNGNPGQPNINPGQPNGNPNQPARPADITRPTDPARVITPQPANPQRPVNQPENNQPRNGQPAVTPAPTQPQPPNTAPTRNQPINPQPTQPQPTVPQPQPQRPAQLQPVQQQPAQQIQQEQQLQQEQQRQQQQRQQDQLRQQRPPQQQPQQPTTQPDPQQLQRQQEQQRQQQLQDQQRQQQQQQIQQRQQEQQRQQPATQPDQQQQQRQQQLQDQQRLQQQQLQQQQLQQRQQEQQRQQDQQRQQQQRERDQQQTRPQQQPQPQPQPQPARPPQPQPPAKTPPKPVTPPA